MSMSSTQPSGRPDPISNRDLERWHRTSVRRIMVGFGSVGLVVLFGVLGYLSHGWSLFESLYMVVITISGVGFGEVRPLASTSLQIHTMMVIAMGMLSVAYTLAGFVQLLTEGEVRNYLGRQRMKRQIEALKGHTIIVGYGRVGTLVADELVNAGMSFVIIERAIERVIDIERRGYPNLHADATEEETLREAGLDRAKTLVTVLPTDAENVFLTLTARRLAPTVEIIARAEQTVTLKTLRQAGADHVVMPAVIGAHRIISLLTNPSSVEFAELVTRRSSLAIEMEEVPVKSHGALDGLSLRDADIGRKTGVMVIAVKRADGRVEFPPSGDEPFAVGDTAVILGRRSNLDLFRQNFKS
ncbi:potassium channel family protein [Tundrisphaera lichenicola]|uniref:potassium channel family protein n=1 Tax=Tundrisphaera lichenicola TaxID=2029860 RepID=UPI003EB6AD92